jgi:RNA polymerase primary sigma factor
MKRLSFKDFNIITPRETESIKLFLKEVNQYQAFSKEEEVEVFKKYKKTNNPRVLEKIIKHNLRFVVSIAKQYIGNGVPFEDLISAGNIGLVKGISGFDYLRGFKFSSYIVWHIRASIIETISKDSRLIKLPTNAWASIRKTEKKLDKDQDIELTSKEKRMLGRGLDSKTTSLDKQFVNEESMTLLDVLTNDNTLSPAENINSKDREKFLNSFFKDLTEKEKYILEKFFGLNNNSKIQIKEISIALGVSSNTVKNIKDKAFYKLKRKARDKKVKEMYVNLFSE